MEGQGRAARSHRLSREGERASREWTGAACGPRASSCGSGGGVREQEGAMGRSQEADAANGHWGEGWDLGFRLVGGETGWGRWVLDGLSGRTGGSLPTGPLPARPCTSRPLRRPSSGRGESSSTCPGPGRAAWPAQKSGSPANLGLPGTFLLGDPSLPGRLGTGSPRCRPVFPSAQGQRH